MSKGSQQIPRGARQPLVDARSKADPTQFRDRAPDVLSSAFASEAHRQSRAVAKSRHAKKDQEFIDAVSDRGKE